MQSVAKMIRVLTIPPVMAVIEIAMLRLAKGCFPGASAAWVVFFLSVLPALSYAVWWAVPALRRRGRKTQRPLAVAFSVAGYLGSAACCLWAKLGAIECVACFTYLLSGLTIAVCSALKIKCSGHASGVSGPVMLLSLYVSPWFLLGYLLLAPVFWSSIKLGRHTPRELALGTVTPVVFILLLSLFFRA